MNGEKRFAAVATGRVQGVGFRVFVVDKAEGLDITGWVKNMPDGSVNMELQGNVVKLANLISIIKKGNFIIKVDNFDYHEIPYVDGEDNFIIKY